MALFIAGDGTALDSPVGWGHYLSEKMPGAAVYHAAAAGASSKSFLAEAKLQDSEEKMKEGDVLLIQFGWNDADSAVWKHTDPLTSYMNCLSILADTARTWGTVPVLLTQVPRPVFCGGKLQASGGDYPLAVGILGRRLGIRVIDLYQQGSDALEEMGEKAAEELFADDGKGEPKMTEQGAAFLGNMVYEALKAMDLLPGTESAESGEGEKKPAAAAWKTEEGGN